MKHYYLQNKICATTRDFKKALFMNSIVTLAFTRKLHENEAFQDQNFSLKIYPRHPLHHIRLPKSQKELICCAEVIEDLKSWSSWGSSLIALSLGFTVIRVLFRFVIDRILFRVLRDRVFFVSSEMGSSSLGSAVIDSSLHQRSFFRHIATFFIKPCYYFFLSKTFVIILKNNCFNVI